MLKPYAQLLFFFALFLINYIFFHFTFEQFAFANAMKLKHFKMNTINPDAATKTTTKKAVKKLKVY
jgi:hypothetical protein